MNNFIQGKYYKWTYRKFDKDCIFVINDHYYEYVNMDSRYLISSATIEALNSNDIILVNKIEQILYCGD